MEKKKKIVFSGCSYSISCEEVKMPFPTQFRDLYDVRSIAYPGQSNHSIIKQIYDCFENEIITDERCLVVCQLTWLHRFGMWHDCANKWLDYQPDHLNFTPKYDEITDDIIVKFDYEKIAGFNDTPRKNYAVDYGMSNDDYDKLMQWYKIYLELIYNEDKEFENLLYRIDTLESYVKSKNHDIIFMYWPPITTKVQLNEMKKRNFFNIGGEYSMLKWSTKNNLLGWNENFKQYDSHLSYEGHKILKNDLLKFIKNKIIKDNRVL